jgi:Carboxypeptidase regulatory-like domain
LGWPVGTVKSRLARGRERLAHRLVRRGLGSDEPLSSHSSAISLVPASLASGTVQAMLRFGAGRATPDIWVQSYNSARPRSGDACLGISTDESGHFELFVPPGPAYLFCRGHGKHLTIFADRDPAPFHFQKAREVTADFEEKSPTPVEFEARIRVRTVASDGPPRKERDLTGRVFDQHGLPIAGVRRTYKMEKFVSGATDRLGLFRLKGLPPGPFALVVDKSGYTDGWATIPTEAQEVELTLPSRPDSTE